MPATAGHQGKGSAGFSLLAGAVAAGVPLALLAKRANDRHHDNCDKADFILRTRDHALSGSQRLPGFLRDDVAHACADRMASQTWARWVFGDTAVSATPATESDLISHVEQVLGETDVVWCCIAPESSESSGSVSGAGLLSFECVVAWVPHETTGPALSMGGLLAAWDALTFTVQHGISARIRLQSLEACVAETRRTIAFKHNCIVARILIAKDSAAVETCCRDLKTAALSASGTSNDVLIEAWHPSDVQILSSLGFVEVEAVSYIGHTYSATAAPQREARRVGDSVESGVVLSVVWFKLPSM
jgi:hypothetical protein